MGLLGYAPSSTNLNRQALLHFERHYIAPEIHQRQDLRTRQSVLARIISTEVVPRLLRLHHEVVPDAPPVAAVIDALRPNSTEVAELALIVLADDLEAAATYVTIMRERGLSMETLYIELLEPTARFLGEMWDRDQCDFIDVTIGVGRLQQLLAIFNQTYSLPHLDARRRVLMATTPGNQHSLGASMIEKLLGAAGWQVDIEYAGDLDQLVDTVRRDWFAVVGLTIGTDRQVEDIAATIVALRNASKNPKLGVLVGGAVFHDHPELALQIGADATAPNAPTAVIAAQKLFDLAMLTSPTI